MYPNSLNDSLLTEATPVHDDPESNIWGESRREGHPYDNYSNSNNNGSVFGAMQPKHHHIYQQVPVMNNNIDKSVGGICMGVQQVSIPSHTHTHNHLHQQMLSPLQFQHSQHQVPGAFYQPLNVGQQREGVEASAPPALFRL